MKHHPYAAKVGLPEIAMVPEIDNLPLTGADTWNDSTTPVPVNVALPESGQVITQVLEVLP